jgi:hypothetical protein
MIIPELFPKNRSADSRNRDYRGFAGGMKPAKVITGFTAQQATKPVLVTGIAGGISIIRGSRTKCRWSGATAN